MHILSQQIDTCTVCIYICNIHSLSFCQISLYVQHVDKLLAMKETNGQHLAKFFDSFKADGTFMGITIEQDATDGFTHCVLNFLQH